MGLLPTRHPLGWLLHTWRTPLFIEFLISTYIVIVPGWIGHARMIRESFQEDSEVPLHMFLTSIWHRIVIWKNYVRDSKGWLAKNAERLGAIYIEWPNMLRESGMNQQTLEMLRRRQEILRRLKTRLHIARKQSD